MIGIGARTQLYVLFEGVRGERRPVGATTRSPSRGIKVRVSVPQLGPSDRVLHLLYRRGHGDLLLGASVRPEPLEEARRQLGVHGGEYLVAAVPIRGRELAAST